MVSTRTAVGAGKNVASSSNGTNGASSSNNGGSILAPIPTTPTTPVEKPTTKGGNTNKKYGGGMDVASARRQPSVRARESIAAASAARPDFHPPIRMSDTTANIDKADRDQQVERSSSVRFDLSASSAFTAVEPRRSIQEIAAFGTTPSGREDSSMAGEEDERALPPESPKAPSPSKNSASNEGKEKKDKYKGSIDVDNVSFTSSYSDNTDGDELGDEMRHWMSMSKSNELVLGEHDQKVSPTVETSKHHMERLDDPLISPNGKEGLISPNGKEGTIQASYGGLFSPQSPPTPLIRNTTTDSSATKKHSNTQNDWIVHQKEPFQRMEHKMPASPPISTRHLLNSGKTLPEFLPDTEPRASPSDGGFASAESNTGSSFASTNRRMTPPLSPLNLNGSVGSMNSSSAKDGDHRIEASSPPLSPFDITKTSSGPRLRFGSFRAARTLADEEVHSPPHSPPVSTLRLDCSSKAVQSVLSLPSLSGSPSNDMVAVSKQENNEEEEMTSGVNHESVSGQTEAVTPPTMSPPTSPPTLKRNNWLQHEKEPFQLEETMREDPISPPMSGSNLMGACIRTIDHKTSGDNDEHTRKTEFVASPPVSPPVALELTTSTLDELNRSQRVRGEERHRRYHDKSSKKHWGKSKERQLNSALQVVRVILKGSDYPGEKDTTSPAACYEAIRQYALLKVEATTLTSQLEDSKEQLKRLYLKWKDMRDDMQGTDSTKSNRTTPTTPSAGADMSHHDSMAILQQLLSDDESVYKEDDTSLDGGDERVYTGSCEPSTGFSMASHVDGEKSVVKAMNALYQELGHEMVQTRTAWVNFKSRVDFKSQEQHWPEHEELKQGSPIAEAEKRDQPDGISCDSSLDMDRIDVNEGGDDLNVSPDILLQSNDSFLLAKIEELTAQIESMEKDRVVLTGYMDRLAKEVGMMDNTTFDVKDQVATVGSQEETVSSDWMTFGHKFPIYRVKEESETEDESGDISSQVQGAKEDTTDLSTSVKTRGYRPPSLVYRTQQFCASNDSDREYMLPIRLPGSRGVSFERNALVYQSGSSCDEEEDILVVQLDEKLAKKLSLSYQEKKESDGIDSSPESKKILARSTSFESYFSTITSLMKLDGNFWNKGDEHKTGLPNAYFLQQLWSSDDDNVAELGIPNFLLDPHSTIFSSPPPVGLDSQLTRKLQSPSLALELALPRKAQPQLVASGDNEDKPEARPSSPLQTLEKDQQEGYVAVCWRLFSTQQNLSRAQAHLSLMHKKHNLVKLQLQAAKREIDVWKKAATRVSTQSASSGFDYSASATGKSADPQAAGSETLSNMKNSTERLVELCKQETSRGNSSDDMTRMNDLDDLVERSKQKLKDQAAAYDAAITKITELENELECLRHEGCTSGNQTHNEKQNAEEAMLLEKVEECSRLSIQVESLTGQLEQQFATVSELESRASQTQRPSEDQGKIENMSGEHKKSEGQIRQLKPALQAHNLDTSSSGGSESSNHESTGTPNSIHNSRSSSESGTGSKLSPLKRTSGVAKVARAGIRNLIAKRFHHKESSSKKSSDGIEKESLLDYVAMAQEAEEEISLGSGTGGTSSAIASTIDAIFEAPVTPDLQWTVETVGEGNSCHSVADDTMDKSCMSSNGSVLTSREGMLVPFMCKQSSIDSFAREDTQLSTIHALANRVKELERENHALQSKWLESQGK